MADTIKKGITISFRGDTSDFDSALTKVNKEMKSLKDETKLINKELKLDPNNIELLEKKFKSLKDTQSNLNEQMKMYEEALKDPKLTGEQFAKIDKEARQLRIDLEYTNRAIEKMGGNTVSVALNGLSGSLKDASKKVSNLAKNFTALSGVATGVITSLGALAYKTVTYADDINTMAKQTGLSTDTLQAFGQMANLIDVDLSTLSKSAVYLTKNLENKKAVDSYKKLGVEIKNANGSFKDTETILFDTLSALQKVTDEQERSLIASDLFGKSYSNLGAILNDANVDISAITDAVKENGAVLSGDELNALNSVNDTIDTLKMKLGGTGTKLVAELSEPLAKITDKVSELADKVFDFVSSLSTEQKEQIIGVIAIVATIAPMLMILSGVISALSTIMSTLATIIGVVSTGAKALWTVMSANPIGAVVLVIYSLVVAFGIAYEKSETFRNGVNKLAESIMTTVTEAIDWGISKINAFIDVLKSAWDWLSGVLSKVGELASSGISKIGSFFGGGSGGFGNNNAYMSGGYGTLQLQTTINVNNNGSALSVNDAQRFGREIVDYVNNKLGRRI